MSENNIAQSFDELVKNIDDHTPTDRLLLTAGLVELLRHTKSPTAPAAMAQALLETSSVRWSEIPFSITKTLMSDLYRRAVVSAGVPAPLVPEILLTALLIFLDSIADNEPTEELLKSIVDSLAESTAAAVNEKK